MASNKEYAEFILEQCEELSLRPMMGEYLLYYHGKLVGGIYDDQLLIKITPSAKLLLTNAKQKIPYAGAKEMLLVDEIENKEFLKKLFERISQELPAPKRNHPQKNNNFK